MAHAQSKHFEAAYKRFHELALEAAKLYDVPLRWVVNGGTHRSANVAMARMDILHALSLDYDLSMPELAILFRFKNHTAIHFMRKRMFASEREWKLKKLLTGCAESP